ncbi:putative GNAT family N-acyltransferase [Pararhizobium capsulatum DSM 1112]|uniref:GNAT family N-acyltransferase n=1 Tax=Pararhizobium capsulatum DSM 1112 TaxID=1121113 RepID=A0ABU0BHX5_9HYPH|nr:GNAT family N-acetyltransferase [Pararhizobium capsulatum]MDQ0317865.1 putative GNAT family N-acyltransferase [Pararhizobium capsulatum DSM 1112]
MSDVVILTVPVFSMLGNAGLNLRREVFVREQHVPADEEFDADDLTAIHFIAIKDGEVCGVLRFITKPEHVKIGRVVVRQDYRGEGIAKVMMKAAMETVIAQNDRRFHLDAQVDKVGFYEKFGFAAYGPEFMDGGMPHRAMKTY